MQVRSLGYRTDLIFPAFDGEILDRGDYLMIRLVADLGIFHSGELGRYQSVQTHPDYRRRGIAGSLEYESARNAFSHFGVDTLVIMTEEGSPAERLYQSVGFLPVEHQVGLEKWAALDRQANHD